MKNKNPFKMIGSYLGLAFGVGGAYFSFAYILYLAETGKFNIVALLIPIIIIAAGFCLGYKTEIMMRKYLNKK